MFFRRARERAAGNIMPLRHGLVPAGSVYAMVQVFPCPLEPPRLPPKYRMARTGNRCSILSYCQFGLFWRDSAARRAAPEFYFAARRA